MAFSVLYHPFPHIKSWFTTTFSRCIFSDSQSQISLIHILPLFRTIQTAIVRCRSNHHKWLQQSSFTYSLQHHPNSCQHKHHNSPSSLSLCPTSKYLLITHGPMTQFTEAVLPLLRIWEVVSFPGALPFTQVEPPWEVLVPTALREANQEWDKILDNVLPLWARCARKGVRFLSN